VMGGNGASQSTRRQVDIEVVRALDGWPARRLEFGQRGHAGVEQGRIWWKTELIGRPWRKWHTMMFFQFKSFFPIE
jgi:hypothetical protein